MGMTRVVDSFDETKLPIHLCNPLLFTSVLFGLYWIDRMGARPRKQYEYTGYRGDKAIFRWVAMSLLMIRLRLVRWPDFRSL